MEEQLEAILKTLSPFNDFPDSEAEKEVFDQATAAITALIQEAVNEGRVDELLYLANSADPLILDRTWIQNRIKELTSSGGSNNE